MIQLNLATILLALSLHVKPILLPRRAYFIHYRRREERRADELTSERIYYKNTHHSKRHLCAPISEGTIARVLAHVIVFIIQE